MFGILLLSSSLFAMDNKKLSQEDKKQCELVSQALLDAHIGLYFRYDDTFPKRISQVVMHGDIPTTFTTEKAYACKACDEYYLKDKPKSGDMIVVVPSDQGKQGSVTIKLERADYDMLTEEIYNNKINNRMKTVERIFDYYNID